MVIVHSFLTYVYRRVRSWIFVIFVHASLLQDLKAYWGSQNRFVVGNSYEAFGSLVT